MITRRRDAELVDTHCHIHSADYALDADTVRRDAIEHKVTKLICVGCTPEDSAAAVDYASRNSSVWASVGVHPHEADRYANDADFLRAFGAYCDSPKVVAIGEIGLDYYYERSSRQNQKKLLKLQLNLALEKRLPVIFHIRDAFDDFWPIMDSFDGVRGVVHSFTSSEANMKRIVGRGLYLGLNGIMTFTKDQEQLKAARELPLDHLLLETDAPFLTPVPFRGNICTPGYLSATAAFLSELRGETPDELAYRTSRNAGDLFGI